MSTWDQEIPKLIESDKRQMALDENRDILQDNRPILVIDTNAFIKYVDLNQLAKSYKIVTTNGILREIKDSQSKQKLEFLVEKIQILEQSENSMTFMNNFAIQTGDYSSLSKQDVELLALAHTIVERKGHLAQLRTQPPEPEDFQFENNGENSGEDQDEEEMDEERQKELEDGWQIVEERRVALDEEETQPTEEQVQGVATGKKPKAAHQLAEQILKNQIAQNLEPQQPEKKVSKKKKNNKLLAQLSDEEPEQKQSEELAKKTQEEDQLEKQLQEQGIVVEKVEESNQNDNANEAGENWEDDEEFEDDNEGWINHDNIDIYLAKSKEVEDSLKQLGVYIMSADFALQNVALQVGIPVLSYDGLIVNKAKRFVLECYACKRLCREVTKIFCPSCGNNALLKVSCSIGSDGKLFLYRKKNFRVNTKGFRFDIPIKTNNRRQDKIILREDDLYQGNMKYLMKKQQKQVDKQYQMSMEFRLEDQDHKLNNGPRVIIPYSRKNPAQLFNQRRKK